MSFDLHLIAFRQGHVAVGETLAARQVIDRIAYTHDERARFYAFHFADGSHVEMYANGLHGDGSFNGAMITLRAGSFSPPVLDLVHDFAAAGRLVIFPTMEPPLVLLPAEELRAELATDVQEDFQDVVVPNGKELGRLLTSGFTAWSAYRDQIAGNTKGTA